MGVIIDEMVANVEQPQRHEGGGEGESRPSDEQQEQSMLDQLELIQERKARLATD